MKANCIKLFLLLLCGLLISDPIPVQAKEKSWKLIFYDDFNSTKMRLIKLAVIR